MVLGIPLRRPDRGLRQAGGAAPRRARDGRVRVHADTVRVGIGGSGVTVLRHGKEISWRASRAGGMTINVTGAGGFVAYVGRLVVR